LWKVSEGVLNSWVSILTQLPNATLTLLDIPPISSPGLLEHVTRMDSSLVSRIRFQSVLPREQHLHVKRGVCGLALDTSPYGGHITTADLLWAGVPVLTVLEEGCRLHSSSSSSSSACRQGFFGKVAASLNFAVSAPEIFTARSLSEYTESAVRIARAYMGAGFNASVSTKAGSQGDGDQSAASLDLLWRPSSKAPLFNAGLWTRGMEKVLLEAAGKRSGEGHTHEL